MLAPKAEKDRATWWALKAFPVVFSTGRKSSGTKTLGPSGSQTTDISIPLKGWVLNLVCTP